MTTEKGGRPLKFNSPEELQSKIDSYFDYCDTTIIKRVINKNSETISEISKPYSITGLADYLDTNRQTLVNYEEKEEFFDTIKKAKAKIEANYEERALINENNAVISIFTLKNNFNWKDRQELDMTTKDKEINMNDDQIKTIIDRAIKDSKSQSK
uniref:Putative terminase small subunit n=1 Tax=viral metagenome TaxID=1070528 RepID=A0A6M3XSH7_9ZZZZ